MDEKKEVLNQQLDNNELEAVTGGERDYATEGCASSVVNTDYCVISDRCYALIIYYKHPHWTENCPVCGKKTLAVMTEGKYSPNFDELYCITCGHRMTKGEYWMTH